MQNQFIFEASPFALANERSATDNSPEYIRRLQQALNRALGLQLPLDGVMSFRTRRAIRNFQRQKGLPADGIVRSDTLRALIAVNGKELSKTSDILGTMEETLESEISGAVNANRLLSRQIGWANGRQVKAPARDRFDTEWEWIEEMGQESEINPVPAIDWCQMRQNIARVARAAERQWTRPNGVKFWENDPSRLPILESYWRTVPGFTAAAAAAAAARRSANNTEAWSAAFICFVMHTAGVRQVHGFEFSQRHIAYIVEALRNRQRSTQNRVFWLADSIEVQHEATPETGDLLCFNRSVNGRMTQHSYESLLRRYWLGGRT